MSAQKSRSSCVCSDSQVSPNCVDNRVNALFASSQAPAWEFGIGSSSFQSREARASQSGFPSWSLGTSGNVALAFAANCQVFLDSCLRYQLAFLVNILNMETDILLSGLEQIGHLLLCQPNGFLFQPHVDFDLAIFGLVNQKLAIFRNVLFFMIAPLLRLVVRRGLWLVRAVPWILRLFYSYRLAVYEFLVSILAKHQVSRNAECPWGKYRAVKSRFENI